MDLILPMLLAIPISILAMFYKHGWRKPLRSLLIGAPIGAITLGFVGFLLAVLSSMDCQGFECIFRLIYVFWGIGSTTE